MPEKVAFGPVIHMTQTEGEQAIMLSRYKWDAMRKAIIVCVDFNDASDRAVKFAMKHFAKCPETKFYFVHCYRAPRTLLPSLSTTPEQNRSFSTQMLADFERFMHKSFMVPDDMKNQKIEAELIMVEGNTVDEICSFAEQTKSQMVICGCTGKSHIRGTFMGSTSMSLMHNCSVGAVVVVK